MVYVQNAPAIIQQDHGKISQAYITELLLELLKFAPLHPEPVQLPSGQENGQEVLLSYTIDGNCYTLLRTRSPTPRPLFAQLSPREGEIVRLVAKGYPNKAIAVVLEISPWTVATHLRRIYGKLSVNTRAEMVAMLMNNGLTVPD
jgi:DNA-binding CsgD family transcriptional regulator